MIGTLKAKQALAEGVLDLRGDLDKLTFSGGRQALLSRLQQLLGTPVSTLPSKQPEPLPVDRSLAFARAAREKLDGALVRCEESYPLEGAHSVLFVVVERDAALWRERLAPIHQELFGEGKWDPLAPVNVEVIDRVTDEALRRLAQAGLIAPSTRAIRSLCSAPGEGNGSVALSTEEQQKALAHRQLASRKLKMVELLQGGGLGEEAREALREATLWTERALAVENRLPEPAHIEEGLRPPMSLLWGDALPTLREIAFNPSLPLSLVTQVLQKRLE